MQDLAALVLATAYYRQESSEKGSVSEYIDCDAILIGIICWVPLALGGFGSVQHWTCSGYGAPVYSYVYLSNLWRNIGTM